MVRKKRRAKQAIKSEKNAWKTIRALLSALHFFLTNIFYGKGRGGPLKRDAAPFYFSNPTNAPKILRACKMYRPYRLRPRTKPALRGHAPARSCARFAESEKNAFSGSEMPLTASSIGQIPSPRRLTMCSASTPHE